MGSKKTVEAKLSSLPPKAKNEGQIFLCYQQATFNGNPGGARGSSLSFQ